MVTPHGKLCPGPVEDHPGSYRRTVAGCSTLDPYIAQPSALIMAALFAQKAIAPLEPREVVEARCVRVPNHDRSSAIDRR